jgi:hypothetical protein
MQLLVVFGAALFLATELPGAFHQIRRGPLIVWWVVLVAMVGGRVSEASGSIGWLVCAWPA